MSISEVRTITHARFGANLAKRLSQLAFVALVAGSSACSDLPRHHAEGSVALDGVATQFPRVIQMDEIHGAFLVSLETPDSSGHLLFVVDSTPGHYPCTASGQLETRINYVEDAHDFAAEGADLGTCSIDVLNGSGDGDRVVQFAFSSTLHSGADSMSIATSVLTITGVH